MRVQFVAMRRMRLRQLPQRDVPDLQVSIWSILWQLNQACRVPEA
jgi:hypothetical protein